MTQQATDEISAAATLRDTKWCNVVHNFTMVKHNLDVNPSIQNIHSWCPKWRSIAIPLPVRHFPYRY